MEKDKFTKNLKRLKILKDKLLLEKNKNGKLIEWAYEEISFLKDFTSIKKYNFIPPYVNKKDDEWD